MSVYMDSGNYTYELIKRGLDTASLRGKAIANNMANVNTKNYKKYVVSFEDSLRDVSEDIKKTGRVKLNNSSIGSIKLEKDEKTSMNINGNNVDIEIEKTNQAANTLLYNALISKVNSKLSMKSYIITGGK
ncbi:flagellar basal body rod protein FlgB [Clostridium mediterraneense]|uniref:flagellar basal body rod protein FlgB n=1 Tax=Clostridium mediterraneense TaxID=1805472 RepID=UPI000830687F|nr:flagellar basal body rod protein FlgB [Clostridium mediterraneense]